MSAERLIPVERLLSRGQHFRCPVLNATLAAGTCLDRQGACVSFRAARKIAARYSMCAKCPTGQQVAERVGRVVHRALPHQTVSLGGRGVVAPALVEGPTPKPAPEAPCANGCGAPRAPHRSNSRPGTEGLCRACRRRTLPKERLAVTAAPLTVARLHEAWEAAGEPIPWPTAKARRAIGWPLEQILTTPAKSDRRRNAHAA